MKLFPKSVSLGIMAKMHLAFFNSYVVHNHPNMAIASKNNFLGLGRNKNILGGYIIHTNKNATTLNSMYSFGFSNGNYEMNYLLW